MSFREDPTRDELLAMAYADGELELEERRRFEARLALEPALARDVAEYRALTILSRQMAPPEPLDHEWRRIASEPAQIGLNVLGWVLFVSGLIGLGGWSLYGIATDDSPLWPRLLALALVGGLLLLLLATTHGRLRTFSLDPYRKVER